MDRNLITARNAAFAALALWRCRDRVSRILNTIAEPRRIELEEAIRSFTGLDSSGIKDALTEVVRREDALLEAAVARDLGRGAAHASRPLRRWIARRERR
jgi:hypothetical protein